MNKIQLRTYRLNEILREIEDETIEIILDRDGNTATATKKEWGFDTKHYFITVNIDVTETGTLDPGGHDEPDEYIIDKTHINIELISIHLDENKIEVGEYSDKIVMAVRGIVEVC